MRADSRLYHRWPPSLPGAVRLRGLVQGGPDLVLLGPVREDAALPHGRELLLLLGRQDRQELGDEVALSLERRVRRRLATRGRQVELVGLELVVLEGREEVLGVLANRLLQRLGRGRRERQLREQGRHLRLLRV